MSLNPKSTKISVTNINLICLKLSDAFLLIILYITFNLHVLSSKVTLIITLQHGPLPASPTSSSSASSFTHCPLDPQSCLLFPKLSKLLSAFWFCPLIFPLSRSSAPDLCMVAFLVSLVSAQMLPS